MNLLERKKEKVRKKGLRNVLRREDFFFFLKQMQSLQKTMRKDMCINKVRFRYFLYFLHFRAQEYVY